MLGIIAKVDDLVVGLLLGAAIGVLVGPILRSAIVARERVEARREARLTEQLIRRLEEMDVEAVTEERDRSEHPARRGSEVASRWRTSH